MAAAPAYQSLLDGLMEQARGLGVFGNARPAPTPSPYPPIMPEFNYGAQRAATLNPNTVYVNSGGGARMGMMPPAAGTSFDAEVRARAAQIPRGVPGATPPPISSALGAAPPGAPPVQPPGTASPAGSSSLPAAGRAAAAAPEGMLSRFGRGLARVGGVAGGVASLDNMIAHGPTAENVIGTVGGFGAALAPKALSVPIAVGTTALQAGMALAPSIYGRVVNRASERFNMVGPETAKMIESGQIAARPETMQLAGIRPPTPEQQAAAAAETGAQPPSTAPVALPNVPRLPAPPPPEWTDPRAFGPALTAMSGGAMTRPATATAEAAPAQVAAGPTSSVQVIEQPDGTRLITNAAPVAAPGGVARAPLVTRDVGRGVSGAVDSIMHIAALGAARTDQIRRERAAAAHRTAIATQALKNQAAEADRQKDMKVTLSDMSEAVWSPKRQTVTTFPGGVPTNRQAQAAPMAPSAQAARFYSQKMLERDPTASLDQRIRALRNMPGWENAEINPAWLR